MVGVDLVNKSEAAVLQSILASAPTSEQDRKRQASVGFRNFERIRKVAYEKGWVYDRFIPLPPGLRGDSVTFSILRPYATDVTPTGERLAALAGTVLLWHWPDLLFTVSFGDSAAVQATGTQKPSTIDRDTFSLTVTRSRGAVPVYFDYEGVWAELAGLHGAIAYPHPLGFLQPGQSLRDSSGLVPSALSSLINRPLLPRATNRPIRVSPFFFPRNEQRLLATGAVERRTLMNLQKVPQVPGRPFERVAFLQGKLASPVGPTGLLEFLAELHIRPFLIVTDGELVLLGMLSVRGIDPNPPRAGIAVLASLNSLLAEIRITREPIDELQVILDHRYDRLID
jgi:hypothetical protein